jgi:hypothetical protein
MLLKSAAIALALAGATFATTGVSSADGFAISTSNRDRGHATTGIAFDFGNVAFGYQDGYWDNGHRWHKWRNRGDHDNYRSQHGDNYRDGNHSRYHGQGWGR